MACSFFILCTCCSCVADKSKVFLYLGIASRLKAMLERSDLSDKMRLPRAGVPADPAAGRRAPTEDDPCSNLHESVGWWVSVEEDKEFGQHDRNIALSLGVDAFQPYRRGGLSIIPFLFQVLNLPEDLRHQPQNMILAAVVPGKKARSTDSGPALTNLNTYLAMLVDELLTLYSDGFQYTCPYDKQLHRVRVKLLFTVCDYPGHAKMNCQQHQGAYFGCQKCDIQGVRLGNTMVYQNFDSLFPEPLRAPRPTILTHPEYLQRNQSLLDAEQTLLKKQKDLADEEECVRDARGDRPRLSLRESAAAKEDRQRNKDDVVRAAQALKAKQAQMRSVKGKSELCRLPYFDIVKHTNLDMMHIVSGVIGAHLVKMVKGERANKQATARARQAAAAVRKDAAAKKKRAAAASSRADEYDFDSNEEECKSPRPAAAAAAAAAPARGRRAAASAAAAASPSLHDDPEASTVREEEQDDGEADEYEDDEFESVDEIAPAVDGADAALRALAHAERTAEKFKQMYHIPAARWKVLEAEVYAKIQSPIGVAPASKHPFTKTGEMTAHHWVNFSRCYGKYLLQQEYEKDKKTYYSAEEQRAQPEPADRGPPVGLTTLCRLIDFIALCLTSNVTEAVKQQLELQLPELAQLVDANLPPNEHAIVLHLLLFHIPDTIRRWGPVRSYWCFPFER